MEGVENERGQAWIFVLFLSVLFQSSSQGHSIIFLLLCHNQPQTSWIKTTHTSYLTVSEGQESGYGSSPLGMSQGCSPHVSQAAFSSEAQLGQG